MKKPFGPCSECGKKLYTDDALSYAEQEYEEWAMGCFAHKGECIRKAYERRAQSQKQWAEEHPRIIGQRLFGPRRY